MISIIAAVAHDNLIGCKGRMPWHIPEDFKYFKKITLNHPIVMGRKTFESIGKPLPNRTNIILTRNADYHPEGCVIYSTIQEIIDNYNDQEIMVIGGQQIYNQFMAFADILYLTYIDHSFEGDTYFPEVSDKEWVKISEEKGLKNEKNPYDYYFQVFKRWG